MSKEEPTVEEVALHFDLHELPTAQHRAGLAGLIFQIDAMGPDGYRRAEELVPVIEALTPSSATIRFTRDSMRGIFDELYAADLVPAYSEARWPGNALPRPGTHHVDRRDGETGEVRRVEVFAYDVARPRAPALARHLEGGREAWLALWRRMAWAILRGGYNVRARAPFLDLAHGRPCREGAAAWDGVVKFREGLARSRRRTEPISGALLLGAQAANAERVPSSGRADHNLLLHFWPLVVLTYVGRVVNRKDARVEQAGYVLAIPDVADLEGFRAEFPAILQGLEERGEGEGTPRRARLDLPAQAGLEALWRFGVAAPKISRNADGTTGEAERPEIPSKGARRPEASRASDRAVPRGVHGSLASEMAGREWNDCVRAVEAYHMIRLGNNVKLMDFSRVAPRPGLVDEYRRIDRRFRNPLFRAGSFRALLRGRPRHWGMAGLLARYPRHFFLEIEGKTPRYLPHFGRDANASFAHDHQETPRMAVDERDHDPTIERLGTIVQSMMVGYVNRKAARKLRLDWDQFERIEGKGGRQRRTPPRDRADEYTDQRRRVCNDAFLQIRSRHDEDFVAFFAGSVLSGPQGLGAREGDLSLISRVLMRPASRDPLARPEPSRDDVKTLAMLALSAYSYTIRKRSDDREGDPR